MKECSPLVFSGFWVVVLLIGSIIIFVPQVTAQQVYKESIILLQFTEEAMEVVNIQIVDDTVRCGISSMDCLFEEHQAIKAERVFRPNEKIENRYIQMGLTRWYRITFAQETCVKSIINEYYQNSCLEHAQLNCLCELDFSPDDYDFEKQWSFRNTGQTEGTPNVDIDACEAWDITTGSPSVVIADLDTGIDLDHPDLTANIWINPGEIPGNEKDDDENGYIDDINGWDFSDDDNNPSDYQGHGTHTAGTIAAVTNNSTGVAGIAGGNGSGGCKIMICKIFPYAYDDSIAEAFKYAADNGAVISSNSWGYSFSVPLSPIIESSINYFISTADGTVVFSAGNEDSDDPAWGYPASYPPVIAVAATDHNDRKAYFSNYGAWVDVSAPGVNILSTIINGYGAKDGTSMACPHVAGVAALLFSANPGITGIQVRRQIEMSADNIDALNPGYEGLLGAGRVNAYDALQGGPWPNPPENLKAKVGDHNDVALTWIDPTENIDGSLVNLDFLTVFRDYVKISEVGPGILSYLDKDLPTGCYTYAVTAVNIDGAESRYSNVVSLVVGKINCLIWQPSNITHVDMETKALERGLSQVEVRARIIEPTSAQAIKEALEANG